MKYIVQTGDMRQVIETPLELEGNGPKLLEMALDESNYTGGLGMLFSVTLVTPDMDAETVDTVELDETVYMKTEYALQQIGKWGG